MPTITTRGGASAQGFGLFGGGRFAFNPARSAASIGLSLGNTKATASAASTQVSAFAVAPVSPGKVYAFTVNSTNGAQNQPLFGAGNASAGFNAFLSVDANSFAVLENGVIFANNVNLGNVGFSYTTGDVIRMKLTATQVQFSKNGGAYSALFTHGIVGALFPGVSLYNTGDAVTGAIE